MTYDTHKNQKLKFVPRTNKRLGVDHHEGIDFFWKTNSRGEYVGTRLATLRADPFNGDFHLELLAGEHAGVEHRNSSYDVLLSIVLLAYDAR